jgi:hypothetical protein
MHCNTPVGSLPFGLSPRLLASCSAALLACLMAFCGLALFGGPRLQAQSTSGGGIQGTVTDPTGAVVAKAQVTSTNTDTGVSFTRETTSSGSYSIAPLPVGTYNVEVVAKGFPRLLQENVDVDNASLYGLNLKLSVGSASDTITVTDAPPALDTTDATLGGTIENELYSALPLSMNGGPRDPTAFQYLMPGVQENPANNTGTGSNNGNSGIYGGSGATNLNENYVEGVPVSNISQQGSSNSVSNAVSVDAVDQFSVQTNGASTSFGGVGATNYTIKSGGNQFHGTVFDFIRNTMFDSWGYFSKVPSSTGFAEKPGEHQNSYGGSTGGPIFKDKLFYFGSYEGYHYTKISNTPQYINIPTTAERTGDFTDALGTVVDSIEDPTTGGSRAPFQGLLNGVPTYNVIPSAEISPISQALQSALPTPTNPSTFNNYLAALPLQNDDYSVDVRLDYTMNSRNKFSVVGIGGNRGYGGEPFYSSYNQLPIPYATGQYINVKTASGILSYTYIVSQSMINSFKYGYTRNWGEGFSLTQGTKYTSAAAGITNLPSGNASNSMPSVSFSATNGPAAPTNWGSEPNTGPQGTNTYTVIDNLQWTRGRHNVTFGAQVQWLETNGGSYGGASNVLSLTYSSYSTGIILTSTSGSGGDSYASFLVGAIFAGSVANQAIQDVGGRYRPMAPYVQDNWQVSPKLTLNLGFRYDYLQPYHEVKNRIAFLDVNITNPIVGVPGVLEYAGFPNASTPAAYAPYICHCTTPVHPYNKNFEPRLGFAYSYNPSTVFNGGFSIQLTHAGGAGGGTGATAGTGNNGEFGATTSFTMNGNDYSTPPAFFLNPTIQGSPSNAVYDPPVQGSQPIVTTGLGPTIPCVAAGTCSPFSAIPPWTVPGITVNPLQTTGNYNFQSVNSDHQNDYLCVTSDNQSCVPQGVNYADPYYGGRGPSTTTSGCRG